MYDDVRYHTLALVRTRASTSDQALTYMIMTLYNTGMILFRFKFCHVLLYTAMRLDPDTAGGASMHIQILARTY